MESKKFSGGETPGPPTEGKVKPPQIKISRAAYVSSSTLSEFDEKNHEFSVMSN